MERKSPIGCNLKRFTKRYFLIYRFMKQQKKPMQTDLLEIFHRYFLIENLVSDIFVLDKYLIFYFEQNVGLDHVFLAWLLKFEEL